MRVLFLCTGNSCRSQMAEGFAKQWLKHCEVVSAGTHPAECVNPRAVQVMQEEGIDISAQYPKHLSEAPRPVDIVITLCGEAAEECPTFPGARFTEHWGLPDPAIATGTPEEVLDTFRRVRDAIQQRVKELAERIPRDE